MKVQSIFANAKLCSNRSLFTIFHPAPQSSREDIFFFNLPTKNKVLIWLCASWKLSLLCYFLLFSQVSCFSREWGPTQNLSLFVAMWGDSLDRCRWVLFAGETGNEEQKQGRKFSPFSGEALMLGRQHEQRWPLLARSVDAAESRFLRLSAFLTTLPPFMPRHKPWAGFVLTLAAPVTPHPCRWPHFKPFWVPSWIKCFQSLWMTRQELNDCP